MDLSYLGNKNLEPMIWRFRTMGLIKMIIMNSVLYYGVDFSCHWNWWSVIRASVSSSKFNIVINNNFCILFMDNLKFQFMAIDLTKIRWNNDKVMRMTNWIRLFILTTFSPFRLFSSSASFELLKKKLQKNVLTTWIAVDGKLNDSINHKN